MSFKKMLILLSFSILISIWLTLGCSDSPTDPPPLPTIDSVAAEVYVDSANAELGDLMTEMIDVTLENADSSFRPRDIDFSSANEYYEQALAADSSNQDAKFGSAFTQMMMFMADDDFNNLIDRFKYTYDTLDFNPLKISSYIPEVGFGNSVLLEGIPLTSSKFTSMLPAPHKLDRAIMSAAAEDPMISDIQAIFESSFLPKIESAGVKLLELIADDTYTFEITPAMQGNTGASPIIIDGSDLRVILAGLYSLESALHIFLSRDLDLTSYSVAGIETAIDRNSSFLSLKPNGVGATHMASAKTNILDAETQLEFAIDRLLTEIGTSQTNHLIKVYPSDEQDLIDAKDTLMHYRTYFDGPKELKIYWSEYGIIGYGQWGPYYGYVKDSFVVDVDISKFFDAPLENPKLFIPDYTITMEELTDFYKTIADTYFSSDRYWARLDSIYGLTYPNDTPYFNNHLPDDTTSDDFYFRIAQYVDPSIFGWSDLYNYCSQGNPNVSCYQSNYFWDYYHYYRYPDQLTVCYSWTADTYETWNWPDPTFNGLFPNYTNIELKDLLMEDQGPWQKADCDTIDADIDF